jgi:hypothetical protein
MSPFEGSNPSPSANPASAQLVAAAALTAKNRHK